MMSFCKNGLMCSAVVGVLAIGVCSPALAADGLSLELRVLTDPLGPIEPLRFELVVTNTGNGPVEGLAPWADHSTVTVEFLPPGAQEWQALEVPRLNHSMQKIPTGGLPLLHLQAGASRSAELSVVADPVRSYRAGRVAYYFAKHGEYKLRATYMPDEQSMLSTEELSFGVEAYAGDDAAAYEWLMSRSIPHFMYDFRVYADNSAHQTDDDAAEIIERFGDSRFAPWAELYLAQCYMFGIRISKAATDPPDLERAAELVGQLTVSQDAEIRRRAKAVQDQIGRRHAQQQASGR